MPALSLGTICAGELRFEVRRGSSHSLDHMVSNEIRTPLHISRATEFSCRSNFNWDLEKDGYYHVTFEAPGGTSKCSLRFGPRDWLWLSDASIREREMENILGDQKKAETTIGEVTFRSNNASMFVTESADAKQ